MRRLPYLLTIAASGGCAACAVPYGSNARLAHPLDAQTEVWGGTISTPFVTGDEAVLSAGERVTPLVSVAASFDKAMHAGRVLGGDVRVHGGHRAGVEGLAFIVNPRYEVTIGGDLPRWAATFDANLGVMRPSEDESLVPVFQPTVGLRAYVPFGSGGLLVTQQIGAPSPQLAFPGSIALDLASGHTHILPELSWVPSLLLEDDRTKPLLTVSAGVSILIERPPEAPKRRLSAVQVEAEADAIEPRGKTRFVARTSAGTPAPRPTAPAPPPAVVATASAAASVTSSATAARWRDHASWVALLVRSDPPGARIFIDGKDAGVAPVIVERHPGPIHVAALHGTSLSGTRHVLAEKGGETLELTVPLRPIASRPHASLAANPGAGEESTAFPWKLVAGVGIIGAGVGVSFLPGVSGDSQPPTGFLPMSFFTIGGACILLGVAELATGSGVAD